MKKIGQFFDRHLGYVLIVPAIIFILLFSILPIAESVRYAFFDFQLNDQQKSGLYFSEYYNEPLFQESAEYVDYYLRIEKDVDKNEETLNDIQNANTVLVEQTSVVMSVIGDRTGTFQVTDDEAMKIKEASVAIQDAVNKIYMNNDEFYAKEDMKEIISEFDTCFVEANFVGLDNFKKVFSDPRVAFSFMITIVFTIASVALELCLGLGLAMIMNQGIKGRGLIRTFSLIPWAIPTSVAALIWAYLFNGSSGIIAVLAEKLGFLADSTDLMLSSTSALSAIVAADVWKTTPYMALLLLAGLQVIPGSMYEASGLDGASKLQQFRYVTLPMLKPAILVALLFRTLDAFRIFDLIYVLTGGGPGGSTESISLYAYKVMFAQTRFGYGSAIVVIMALVVAVISYFYIKFLDVELISEK